MKKLIAIILVAALVVAGVIFVPKLIHTCDSCDEVFVGLGYEPNAISDMVTEEDQTICKECAEAHHAVSLALGKSLDEYRKDLF